MTILRPIHAAALAALVALPALADTAPQTADIRLFTFQPAELTVPVGTSVVWVNHDDIVHTVTAEDGSGIDSGDLGKGGSFEQVFETPGTYQFICTRHPHMTVTVNVTP